MPCFRRACEDGFDQDKVSPHFHLTQTGGSIEVRVNQSGNADSRKQIRDHLRTISQEFARGVFTSRIATHAELPPGAPVMRERKSRISYAYEETPDDARVIIGTTDRAARTAVHDFLKYQIREMRPAIRYLFRNESAAGARAASPVLGDGEDFESYPPPCSRLQLNPVRH